MTHPIIKTDNYILITSDEEIKVGNVVYDTILKKVSIVKRNLSLNEKYSFQKYFRKIIAHLPLNNSSILEGVPLLPPLPDEEDNLYNDAQEYTVKSNSSNLDGEDVEFNIVNYHGTGLISKGWDGYAKILGMYQQEPLLTDEEIAEFKADIKEAMKKSVSDEDIEKMADEMQSLIKSSNRTDAFILGAKCMRDKILNK